MFVCDYIGEILCGCKLSGERGKCVLKGIIVEFERRSDLSGQIHLLERLTVGSDINLVERFTFGNDLSGHIVGIRFICNCLLERFDLVVSGYFVVRYLLERLTITNDLC